MIMRKFLIFLCILCTALLYSCGPDVKDLYDPEAIDSYNVNKNASSIFGSIDPKQDWNSSKSGTITITADADMKDIAKVQILTESPFFNTSARVLNEIEVTKGQTVELNYTTPNVYSRLFAACVSSSGVYYVKGFDTTEKNVSFTQTSSAPTRADAATLKAAYNFPDLKYLALEMKNMCLSYGAMRSIRSAEGELTNSINLWNGKGWDNERLWRISDNNAAATSTWYITAQTLRRDIDPITDAEKTELEDIFRTYLWRQDAKDAWGRKDNMEIIKSNPMFSLENNNFTSTGEPMTIIPVQMSSSEIQYCHLYYYYYNPADVRSLNKDQFAQFVKDLPKFKAVSCHHTKSVSGVAQEQFFKKHEYLLPYYGDGPLFNIQTLSGYTTDGKLFRIRNGRQLNGADYYMSYSGDENKRMVTYDAGDNEMFQLWQVFTNADGKSYLYNIGSRAFLYYTGSWNTAFTPAEYIGPDCQPYIIEGNHILRSSNTKQGLGTDLGSNNGIWSDKNSGIGDRFEWYFDEYTGSREYQLKTAIESTDSYTAAAKNYAIPEGYKVGFMLRKLRSNDNDCYNHYAKRSYTANNNGEVYGDGRLNNEINQFPGHFNSATTRYKMQIDDPRIAMFNANGKTYMTFEDGSDAQFSDLIVEVTGGVKKIEEPQNVEANSYTMCFEDRPKTADYDMNDVVLRVRRVNATHLQVSLIACGGQDRIMLHGIAGSRLLEGTEIHELFGLDEDQYFVNTQKGGLTLDPISEIITVDKSVTIEDFMKNIYIENVTQGNIIRLPKAGDAPFAIIVPIDFKYPLENQGIYKAYPNFLEWAQNVAINGDWYLFDDADKIYPELFSGK